MQALYYNTGSFGLTHLLGLDITGSYTQRFDYSNITELIPCSSLQEIVAFKNGSRYASFPIAETNLYYTDVNFVNQVTSSVSMSQSPYNLEKAGIFPINFIFSPSLINTSSLDTVLITKNVLSSSGDTYATGSLLLTASFDANTLILIKNNTQFINNIIDRRYFENFIFFVGLTESHEVYNNLFYDFNLDGFINMRERNKGKLVDSGSNGISAAENLAQAINLVLSGSNSSSSLDLLMASASGGTLILSSSYPGTLGNDISLYSYKIPSNFKSASSIDYYFQNKILQLSGGTDFLPEVYTTESIISASTSIFNGTISLVSGESYNIIVSGSGQFYTSSIIVTNTATRVVELYATASNQYLTASFYPLTSVERTIEVSTGVLPSLQLSWVDTGSMPYSNTGSLSEWSDYLQSQITIISSSSDTNLYFAGSGLANQQQLNLLSQNINTCNLFGFTNLNSININGNLLSSFINLDEAPNLVYYDCGNNNITGSIPDFTHANTISTIICSNNKISGSLSGLLYLPYLSKLDCSYNFITGSTLNLSSSYGVTYLNFSNNQLSGGLEDLTGANSLQYFNCSNNNLSGSISNLSNLYFLQDFYCQNNILTGSIPDLSNTQIVNFDCSNNLLDGGINNLISCSSFINFNCSYNLLTGSIPDLSSTINLSNFDCSNNSLGAGIPNLDNNINLTNFNCGYNFITGSIPNLLNNQKLVYFRCNNNNITGSIDIGNVNIQLFDCSVNNLDGSIINIGGSGSLKYFDCSYNYLIGTIPSISDYSKLEYFNCSNNNLTGSIPDTTNNNNLTTFICNNNNLDGGINSLGRFIQTFDCSNNYLTGSIPNASLLSNLQYFNCENNNLSGGIDLTGLSDLDTFMAGYNELSGSILSLSGCINLVHFDCLENELTGSIPSLNSCVSLSYFDVSGNKITGSIPDLANNQQLTYLGLDNNKLTGYTTASVGTISPYLLDISAGNNLLTQAAVDGFLHDLDVAGGLNGQVFLNGTGNAIPSATGLLYTASLKSKGWYVGVNH